jgi:hypothetical protein
MPDGTPIVGGCGLLHRAAAPAVVADGRRLAEQIAFDVGELVGYLPRVTELLEPTNAPMDTGGHRKGGKRVTGSPAPWNGPAGMLLMDVHAGARQLEDSLTVLAHGHRRAPQRSVSDADTTAALAAVPWLAQLCKDRLPGHSLPRHAARQVYGWALAARRLLDEARPDEVPWTRAPGGLRCPGEVQDGRTCDRPLWLAPGATTAVEPPVYCRWCTDADGNLMSWPWGAWVLAATIGPTA